MRSVDVTVADIVGALGGELQGSPSVRIARIMSLESATPSDISFLSAAKYAAQFAQSMAGCVIARRADWLAASSKGFTGVCILTDDPYLYFAKLTTWWKKKLQAQSLQMAQSLPLIHPTAVISPHARIAPDSVIGALCVIEEGASIGARTILKSRVTVGADCHIGDDCILHSGVVIGADGFGFAPNKATGEWVKIEQLGAVHIGNQVEVGANTCIDRGALGDTVIEDGVKLDNLIQIGHNVHIGKHTALAGCVGVAGSAKIGGHCTVGGGAVVLGHLELADHVHISAATVVIKSIKKAGNYTGIFPIDDNQSWEKNAVTLKQLHSLRERIKQLELALEQQQKDI
jgi:UDP-3-O-[3-hydroxymyristoyl] glucosamine N-acyltransferase